MKKILLTVAVLAVIATGLAGCANISTQGYNAVGLVYGNTPESAYMKFARFSGNMDFVLDAGAGEKIHCSAALEEGSATVYVKTDNSKKEELFTVSAGKDVDTTVDVKAGDVMLIVESNETCKNGDIRFEIEEVL